MIVTSRLHTRFNITPSGLCAEKALTIANAYTARLNWWAAHNSGGTFIVTIEDVIGRMSGSAQYAACDEVCQAIVEQLLALGLHGSNSSLLESFGLPGNCRIQYMSEYQETAQAIWRTVLADWRELYGDWPPALGEYEEGGDTWAGDCLLVEPNLATSRATGPRPQQPYLVFQRLWGDLRAGRNYFYNGRDCQVTRDLYQYFARRLGVACPAQQDASLILWEPVDMTVGPGLMPIATGLPDNNYFVTDLLASGRSVEEFWNWMDERLQPPNASPIAQTAPSGATLRYAPIIREVEWNAFLGKRGGKRK